MIIIDATNRTLGRVASEAAKALLGKTDPKLFARNKVADQKVRIENAAKTTISEKKKKQTIYKTYTQYPGGLNSEALGDLLTRRGYKEVYRIAVKGMLPKNRLQTKRLKNLTITD